MIEDILSVKVGDYIYCKEGGVYTRAGQLYEVIGFRSGYIVINHPSPPDKETTGLHIHLLSRFSRYPDVLLEKLEDEKDNRRL